MKGAVSTEALSKAGFAGSEPGTAIAVTDAT
jgi:hypothetical protein